MKQKKHIFTLIKNRDGGDSIGIFERVAKASQTLLNNAYPNEIRDADKVDEPKNRNCEAVDLYKATPSRVKDTVKNRRFGATHDSQVQGILMDLMTKTNTKWYLEGDNEKAIKHIEEMCEEWDLDTHIDDALWKGFVDSQAFRYDRIVENHIRPNFLAYDGSDFKIKEVYDENGELLGYKQVIKRNVRTNKGWLRKKFDELEEDLDELEISYTADEICHYKYMERDGKPHSLMSSALEPIYYKRILREQMPLTVYKNSNIISVTVGNENKMSFNLSEEERDNIADAVNDYHKKGCIILPYGVEVELLKGGTLPQIQDYIKYFEKEIYTALNTPEAVFSSESSNRATADIQLDSPTTGRVVFLQYNQDWVAKYVNDLFAKELALQHINGKVWIEFEMQNQSDEELQQEESDDESLHKPIRKKGQEDQDRTDSTRIARDGQNHRKNHDVPNITREQPRYNR